MRERNGMTGRKRADCLRVRATLEQGRGGSAEEAHLFVCSDCRTEARFAAAWKELVSPRDLESAGTIPVDEHFVRNVIGKVRADRVRRERFRVRLIAAAALVFFFLAGASQRIASTSSAGAEETYAQMVTPDIESDLPD